MFHYIAKRSEEMSIIRHRTEGRAWIAGERKTPIQCGEIWWDRMKRGKRLMRARPAPNTEKLLARAPAS